MNKKEFLDKLKTELERQSISNIENMIEFYDEMICDRMEDGMSEEEAVDSMESIDEIVHEAVLDKSVPTLVKERVKKSREKAKRNGLEWLWIVLAIVGFPVWLPIAIALIAVAFTLFIVFWVLIFTLFVVLLALGISSVACVFGGFILLFGRMSLPAAIAALGIGLILAGICVLVWKPCVALVKNSGKLFSDMVAKIKAKIFSR